MSAVEMAPYIARLHAELREELGQSQAVTSLIADEGRRVENVLYARGIATIRELEILMLALGWEETGNKWGRVMGGA